MYKTYQPKSKEVKRNWHLVNAKDEILGRISTQIATFLMGKHKPEYSQHMDIGDFVVVINAAKVELSGQKEDKKVYKSHSGYPGGYSEVTYKKMILEHPTRVIEKAVYGMLPGNRLRAERMKRLRIYKDDNHPYNNKFKTNG